MRPMHEDQKARFVTEFPFLDLIPNLDKVGKIHVAPCENAVLRDVGVEDGLFADDAVSPELEIGHTFYYAVCGNEVHKLRHVDATGKRSWDAEFEDEEEDEPTNGRQLYDLGLRPDYIVKCHLQPGAHCETWTVYRMKSYHLDAFYRQARYPKVTRT